MMTDLKSFSDNSNISVISMLSFIKCFFTQFDDFLIFGMVSNFQLKLGHFSIADFGSYLAGKGRDFSLLMTEEAEAQVSLSASFDTNSRASHYCW